MHKDREIPKLAGQLTLPEVAAEIGVSRQQVHKLIDSGAFEFGVSYVGAASKPVYLVAAGVVEGYKARRAAALVEPSAE